MHASWSRWFWLPVVLGTAYAGEEAAPSVAFLEGDAGRDAIADESVEPYFSLLQKVEIEAKTLQYVEAKDLAGQREECRKRYREAIRSFTPHEKDVLTAIVGRIHAAWADEYPIFAETPWSFLKVASQIEGGMPHTRGKSIAMPESEASFLARLSPDGPGAASFAELLVHEQSHVVQRLHPEVFAALYTGPWGFVRAKGLADGEWLESRQVVNPDGVDLGWVFPMKDDGKTAYIQPFLIFAERKGPPRMPADIREIAVSVEKSGGGFRVMVDADGQPVFRPLAAVREYKERFGVVGENFHPNEIFACVFSRMVVFDHFGGKAFARPCELVGPDFATLRTWCREHFKK